MTFSKFFYLAKPAFPYLQYKDNIYLIRAEMNE